LLAISDVGLFEATVRNIKEKMKGEENTEKGTYNLYVLQLLLVLTLGCRYGTSQPAQHVPAFISRVTNFYIISQKITSII